MHNDFFWFILFNIVVPAACFGLYSTITSLLQRIPLLFTAIFVYIQLMSSEYYLFQSCISPCFFIPYIEKKLTSFLYFQGGSCGNDSINNYDQTCVKFLACQQNTNFDLVRSYKKRTIIAVISPLFCMLSNCYNHST